LPGGATRRPVGWPNGLWHIDNRSMSTMRPWQDRTGMPEPAGPWQIVGTCAWTAGPAAFRLFFSPFSHRITMPLQKFLTAAVLLAGIATSALAQPVDVKHAWVRASVPGQNATGAFMIITARSASRLVAITSPAAGVAEVHEMKMDNGIMRMRAVDGGLELPAGKPVELASGGYHVMLMDLKSALPKGSTVPMTLVLKDAKGVESRVELKLPVATGPVAHQH
jgi:copper(I)-binding protein